MSGYLDRSDSIGACEIRLKNHASDCEQAQQSAAIQHSGNQSISPLLRIHPNPFGEVNHWNKPWKTAYRSASGIDQVSNVRVFACFIGTGFDRSGNPDLEIVPPNFSR